MPNTPWNHSLLMKTSDAYWKSCTLHAGVKLDLFSLIGESTVTAQEVAKKVLGSTRGVPPLLEALAAMGLLKKRGDTYINPPFTHQYLTRKSPDYIGHILLHHHHLVSSWQQLDKAVLTGAPVNDSSRDHTPEERESFLLGMYNIASFSAPDVARSVDLSGCSALLDLGGGPGTYAIHFCQENPGLKAWVYDLASTEPFARQIIAKHRMDSRVSFVPFDFNIAEFKEKQRFDATWLSHILHSEGPEEASAILAKTTAALNPGGKLLIQEFILDDTRDGPLFPALFSLNMLVVTARGKAYSEAELKVMMAEAGLTDLRRIDLDNPNGAAIIEGFKK